MTYEEADIPGVWFGIATTFEDSRGQFLELGRKTDWDLFNFKPQQSNLSVSKHGVLRGLHFQKSVCQAQMFTVIVGEIFDVVVDLRIGSPNFGKWVGAVLSSSGGKRQLFHPKGFAHGFLVLSDFASVQYLVEGGYEKKDEGGLLWSCGAVGIDWPIRPLYVNVRDSQFKTLNQLENSDLPSISIE